MTSTRDEKWAFWRVRSRTDSMLIRRFGIVEVSVESTPLPAALAAAKSSSIPPEFH
jgi:hypothetical protein